jgi:hypothetical protein
VFPLPDCNTYLVRTSGSQDTKSGIKCWHNELRSDELQLIHNFPLLRQIFIVAY